MNKLESMSLTWEKEGLAETKANEIRDAFLELFNIGAQWKEKALALVVTSVDQKEEMKQAREARLALVKVRTSADKIRKELKADALKYGNAVQGVYNLIEGMVKPLEEHLQKQEDFAKIQKEKEEKELRDMRNMEAAPYVAYIPTGVDLGKLSEEDSVSYTEGSQVIDKSKSQIAYAEMVLLNKRLLNALKESKKLIHYWAIDRMNEKEWVQYEIDSLSFMNSIIMEAEEVLK
jgi:hypothetical protein